MTAATDTFIFTKIKLAKHDFVEYEASARVHRGTEQVHETSSTHVDKLPHEDLLRAFHRLTVHFCLVTESLNRADFGCETDDELEEQIRDDSALECVGLIGFACRGLSWGAKGNGFTLSGRRWLRSGKAVNFNTPFIDEENDDYPFLGLLRDAIRTLHQETSLYLNGKFAVEKEPEPGQLPLDFTGPLQDVVDNAAGFTSLTISSGGRSVTLEKGQKPKRTYNGQELDDDE
ncbi:hypothetical protein LJ737_19770 [Hymenobacter sp. 15J16-1T3B]|uniref:hypothetical protein n=1 Tax=Hymenobacter sp. 15J16-1T3B TaxID=2886941 RepID=UPI001D110349|nr:hypothetical protein [Hymenobacter sp. 15J16-1T3B]MCC3159490.1 hypothetical protein [Hymenobacter sp. 15J16-1T3B]